MKGYFVTMLITYQGLSFGGFSLKIELVDFVYELIIYMKLFFITWLCNEVLNVCKAT